MIDTSAVLPLCHYRKGMKFSQLKSASPIKGLKENVAKKTAPPAITREVLWMLCAMERF
ncbi:hypothetical protein [Desulfurispirillum indicum]|uniref:hypothetical protein n=1 Tax=Desulfurispirillum indicum TaxID=936456 RepID=UPI000301CF16|nr:hypothetical protein [Desulfurispirillum indicum]